MIEQSKMTTTASFIDKCPSMDWSREDNLYSRFKLWKQRCEMRLTDPMVKIDEEVQCKHLLCWSCEHGMELFNSLDLSADDQKKLKKLLGEIRKIRKTSLKRVDRSVVAA